MDYQNLKHGFSTALANVQKKKYRDSIHDEAMKIKIYILSNITLPPIRLPLDAPNTENP